MKGSGPLGLLRWADRQLWPTAGAQQPAAPRLLPPTSPEAGRRAEPRLLPSRGSERKEEREREDEVAGSNPAQAAELGSRLKSVVFSFLFSPRQMAGVEA